MPSLSCGGQLLLTHNALLLSFHEPRRALSTALWGGGFRSVRWALNQKLTGYWLKETDFPGGSPAEFLRLSLEDAGCAPGESCAFLTSATMEHYRHAVRSSHGLALEVIATGGVEKTAVRAGDPPLYREEAGQYIPLGTINLIVHVSAALPDYAMVRALLTCTEGKAAALQDLGTASIVSGLPATGTATDGIILLTDPAAPALTDAGTFSLLGSLLAGAVHDTVVHCLTDFGIPWNTFESLKTPEAADVHSHTD